jgi:hypothetical protein
MATHTQWVTLEPLATGSRPHPKGDPVWKEDSVGGTPTGATETVALPRKLVVAERRRDRAGWRGRSGVDAAEGMGWNGADLLRRETGEFHPGFGVKAKRKCDGHRPPLQARGQKTGLTHSAEEQA